MLSRLLTEADVIRREKSRDWQAFDEAVAKVLGEHAEKYKNWRMPSFPPRPSLAPLKLPLAYLTWQSQQQRPPDVYLAAIAESPDERRIDVLLELARQDRNLGQLVVKAMTPERVVPTIGQLLAERPRLESYGAPFLLIERFTDRLPEKLRRDAYDYIKNGWGRGPGHRGFDGGRYWRVLFKLDRERARREAIPYYWEHGPDSVPFNSPVVQLLYDFSSPSPEVAHAARQWLAQPRATPPHIQDFHDISLLRMLLVRSDPDHELASYVRYIDQVIAEIKAGEPKGWVSIRGDWLVHMDEGLRGLIEALYSDRVAAKAVADFRRWATEGVISPRERVVLVEYLVRTSDPEAERIVRHWMTVEDKYARSDLLKTLSGLGEPGQAILEKLRAGTPQ